MIVDNISYDPPCDQRPEPPLEDFPIVAPHPSVRHSIHATSTSTFALDLKHSQISLNDNQLDHQQTDSHLDHLPHLDLHSSINSKQLPITSIRNDSPSPSPPPFPPSLSYTDVRDYAYPPSHPLHYGIPPQPDPDYPPAYRIDGGPPWREDPDLASPVVTLHAVGDRLSREFEFSVASADEIHGRAVALFDFVPENDNEAPLAVGQVVWVSYRHGQGWLVAEDPATGETGLVPEEYVRMLPPHAGDTSNDSL